MKNPLEVLRAKEQEVIRVKQEVEALRTTARLLEEDGEDEQNGNGHHVVQMP